VACPLSGRNPFSNVLVAVADAPVSSSKQAPELVADKHKLLLLFVWYFDRMKFICWVKGWRQT